MQRHSIKCLSWLVLLGTLAGCATNKEELMPHGPNNMLDLWNQSQSGVSAGPINRTLLDARMALRRPVADGTPTQHAYTRTAANEIYSQFKRLPNPDLVMYVFPHLAGTDPAPVPGYSTVFPFYQRVQYAMPGERTEDY
jgi:conjugative transfer region lipoprotein (TIGR03751 family)